MVHNFFELEYIKGKAWNNCLSGAQDAGKHANYDVFSVPQNEETAEVLFDDIDYLATWKAMEELVKKGKVKSIGKFSTLNPKFSNQSGGEQTGPRILHLNQKLRCLKLQSSSNGTIDKWR